MQKIFLPPLLFLGPAQANSPISSSATSSSVTLEWIEVEEGNAHRDYMIKWDPPAEDGSSNKTIDANKAAVGNLNGSTLYQFSVSSMNDGGKSEKFSNPSFLPTSMYNCILLFIAALHYL